ncbi:hypothetical protein D3C86_1547220 [compost metagenome]
MDFTGVNPLHDVQLHPRLSSGQHVVIGVAITQPNRIHQREELFPLRVNHWHVSPERCHDFCHALCGVHAIARPFRAVANTRLFFEHGQRHRRGHFFFVDFLRHGNQITSKNNALLVRVDLTPLKRINGVSLHHLR